MGGSNFLLRGGGGVNENNDDADFLGVVVYLNPVSDAFQASYNIMETIKISA